MLTWLSYAAYLAILAVSLLGLHRLGLLLEGRGWLNYTRETRRSRPSLVMAAVLDPNARQVLELQEEEQRQERDEDGEQGANHEDTRWSASW